MTTTELRDIIKYDMHKIPDFINHHIELHKYRYDLIANIIYNLELCIDENVLDYDDLMLYDDSIALWLGQLEETCCLDKAMMFHIWAYLTNCYEYYLGLSVSNDLFESAANLQKIKCLNIT